MFGSSPLTNTDFATETRFVQMRNHHKTNEEPYHMESRVPTVCSSRLSGSLTTNNVINKEFSN